ncbi:MAG: 4Fe-4S binding protein [Candidatus Thalassarchaeaceae archaeon]
MIFQVDEDRCFGCAACVALCPVNALILDGLLAIVDEPECTHCEHCIPACPVHALSLVNVKETFSIGVLA